MNEISDKYKLDKKVLQRFKAGVILKNLEVHDSEYKKMQSIIEKLDNEIKSLKTKN